MMENSGYYANNAQDGFMFNAQTMTQLAILHLDVLNAEKTNKFWILLVKPSIKKIIKW